MLIINYFKKHLPIFDYYKPKQLRQNKYKN